MKKFVSNHISIASISVPASKSVAQRVLFGAALSTEPIEIFNLGLCDDVLHIKEIITQLGAEVIEKENSISVIGRKQPIASILNCGESGLGIRLTTSIASTFGKKFTIKGEGSLLKRPLTQFTDFLPQMGVEINEDGKLPLQLSGQLKGGEYTVDGSLSSQYISGLLMALPLCQEDSILHVTSPTSLPYIDITLSVLDFFGIKIEHHNYSTYTIKGNQTYSPQRDNITIEGDWSSAAFWIVYGTIKGDIALKNLNKNSTQADKAILNIIKKVGASYKWINDDLIISKNTLIPFTFDATNCPDLFPILVVLAASIKGTSVITGVNRLKYKESDRGLVLQTQFAKLGLKMEINGNKMTIYGKGYLNTGEIHSNNDHRIAMSAAIAAILTEHGITVLQAESVNKSYPNFWDSI
jgi:3-phosphoshikimate 1-carboxyvinyltransferase